MIGCNEVVLIAAICIFRSNNAISQATIPESRWKLNLLCIRFIHIKIRKAREYSHIGGLYFNSIFVDFLRLLRLQGTRRSHS